MEVFLLTGNTVIAKSSLEGVASSYENEIWLPRGVLLRLYILCTPLCSFGRSETELPTVAGLESNVCGSIVCCDVVQVHSRRLQQTLQIFEFYSFKMRQTFELTDANLRIFIDHYINRTRSDGLRHTEGKEFDLANYNTLRLINCCHRQRY